MRVGSLAERRDTDRPSGMSREATLFMLALADIPEICGDVLETAKGFGCPKPFAKYVRSLTSAKY